MTKRRKHVFRDADEVCHVWAADRGPETKTLKYSPGTITDEDHGKSSNCYFHGDRLYSYGSHYVLGQFYRDKKGKRVAVVINTHRYSVTTATHISSAVDAVRGLGVKVFRNDHPNCVQTGLASMTADLLNKMRQLQTKRVGVADVDFSYNMASTAIEEFAAFFKLKVNKKTWNGLREAYALAVSAAQKRDDAKAMREAWTPEQKAKHEAKLERDKEQRAHVKQMKEVDRIIGQMERFVEQEDKEPSHTSYWNVPSELRSSVVEALTPDRRALYDAIWPRTEVHLKRITAQQAEARRIEAEAKARAKELIPQAEQSWREGADYGRYYPSQSHVNEEVRLLAEAWRMRPWDAPTLLRIKDDRVETSRGAMVTVKAGRLLFALYQRVMDRFDESQHDEVFMGGKFMQGANQLNETNSMTTIDSWYPTEEIRVEHYRLDVIRRDGVVKVGCHFMRKEEVDLFIERYGWAKQSALHAVK